MYMTPNEVSKLLKMSVSRLADWRATWSNGGAKLGPQFFKMGESRNAPVRYASEVVDAWVKAQSAEVSP